MKGNGDRFDFHRLDAFCVGRREGNIAGCAVIVRNFGVEVYRHACTLGDVSRHFAGYSAVVTALKFLRTANTAGAHVSFSSQLVAMQLLRRWKLNLKADYMPLSQAASEQLIYLRRFSLLDYYIDREADELCRAAIAEQRGKYVAH